MDESLTENNFQNIHFPRQVDLVKKLRVISFIINDITLLVSLLVILYSFISFFGLNNFFQQQQILYLFTPVLFIFSAIPLFFGAKKHLIDTHRDAAEENRPWWEYVAPIFFASLTAFFGFINFIGLTNNGALAMFHISEVTGFCFFLVGLALIPPFTQIPHRFHITQSLVFIVSSVNVFFILENVYQYFSPSPMQHLVDISLPAAFSFVFFCSGLLLRWSNRGFFGNFTLDSTASIFALRVFIINLISAPLIAFFVLFMMQQTQYNMYIVLTVVVICFAVISSLLLWLNVRILYGHELEHLLMRESLRSHNIDLTKEQEELQKRMGQLEQEKKKYLDKLSSQNAWQDAADRLE